jgi:hypothetical protein
VRIKFVDRLIRRKRQTSLENKIRGPTLPTEIQNRHFIRIKTEDILFLRRFKTDISEKMLRAQLFIEEIRDRHL